MKSINSCVRGIRRGKREKTEDGLTPQHDTTAQTDVRITDKKNPRLSTIVTGGEHTLYKTTNGV